MNEELASALSDLCTKIDVTSECVWSALIKQSYVYATSSVFGMIFLTALVALLYAIIRKKTKVPPKTEKNPYPRPELDDESCTFAWVAWFFLLAIYIIALTCTIYEVIGIIINPEYWAITKLLG